MSLVLTVVSVSKPVHVNHLVGINQLPIGITRYYMLLQCRVLGEEMWVGTINLALVVYSYIVSDVNTNQS